MLVFLFYNAHYKVYNKTKGDKCNGKLEVDNI